VIHYLETRGPSYNSFDKRFMATFSTFGNSARSNPPEKENSESVTPSASESAKALEVEAAVTEAATQASQKRHGTNLSAQNGKLSMPETRGTSEGSARRNIMRKGQKQAGLGSKMKARVTDDGSAVLYGDQPSLDPGDPAFEPYEDDDNYVLVSNASSGPRSPPRRNYDPDFRRQVIGPMLTLAEFKRRVTETLDEFFSSEDVEEALRTIKELGCEDYHYELVKRSISMGMDRKERERELVSKLLSAASMPPNADSQPLLNLNQLGKGFERLMEFIDDLEIDAPGATDMAAAFLARAVVDEILPPAFLADPVVVGIGGDVVQLTRLILSQEHQYSRVERIWGPGDGRPVKELKIAMDQLLSEYLLSGDLIEAARCTRELASPHFHHELVKRAVVLVLDKPEGEQLKMSRLLKDLHACEILSPTQVLQGFDKLRGPLLAELKLDSPQAGVVIEALFKLAESDGLLPPTTAQTAVVREEEAAALKV